MIGILMRQTALATAFLTAAAPGLVQAQNKVVLRLSHLAHALSADIDMLLTGPGGKAMIPMSDAGGFDAPDIDLAFDDDAETPLPDTAALFGGTHRPTNRGAALDIFPAPAPPKPWDGALAVFKGSPANGAWKLFVRDDKAGAFGALGGWSIEISYAH